MKEIIEFSDRVVSDIFNFQGTGGNISIKEDGILYIKASGYRISDISKNRALSKVSYSDFIFRKNSINSDMELNTFIKNNDNSGLKPSIETGFHLILDKYVLHCHNVYLNIILCMQSGDLALEEMLDGFDFVIIEYKKPGFDLYSEIDKLKYKPEILLLKNHGIILHSDKGFDYLYDKLHSLEQIMIQKFELKKFELIDKDDIIRQHIFPDTIAIGDVETNSSHFFIKSEISRIGGKIRYLSKDNVLEIRQMKDEKYRKKIFDNIYKG